MTARQLALDCDPTWLDPEPDDDDGPWCQDTRTQPTTPYGMDLRGQHATPHQLHTMTTVPVQGGIL